MTDDTKAVPLIEEVAHIEKRAITTGKVTVRTAFDTHARLLEASLSGQTVHVERVPVDREVTGTPEVRTEGNVTIVPVLEERLIVEKRLFLVEEVRLTVSKTVEKVEVPVELRKQRAVIERTDGKD